MKYPLLTLSIMAIINSSNIFPAAANPYKNLIHRFYEKQNAIKLLRAKALYSTPLNKKDFALLESNLKNLHKTQQEDIFNSWLEKIQHKTDYIDNDPRIFTFMNQINQSMILSNPNILSFHNNRFTITHE